MESYHLVIAIDGPAASGKSSVARALARRLSILYVNTGAMYRAVTWHAVANAVSTQDSAAVVELLRSTKIECGVHEGQSNILINGVDPEPYLLLQEVNANVSNIAAIAEVRQQLVELQRLFAVDFDNVMEGRDIGSAVFPETPYKFYIDASTEVRLMRRQRQGLQDSISARDRQDSSRRTSPLIIAEDAHVIDSSHLTIDGVVGEIIGRLKLKGMTITDCTSQIVS